MGMPITLGVFCQDFLGLSPPLTKRLWHSIVKSDWSEVVSLRQNFQLHESLPHLDFAGLVDRAASPARFTKMLESLVTQTFLSRADANAIEERVLLFTTKEGRWPAAVAMQEGMI